MIPVRLAAALDAPVVVRGYRERARSAATPAVITLALGVLAAVACALFSLAAAGAPEHRPNSAQMARVAYHAMSLQVALVALLAPALAAAAISREREHGTLDLLLAGELSEAQIVRSKLASTVSYLALSVVAVLPLYVAVFLHAGLNLGHLALAELLTLATAVAGAAFGLFMSALCPRTSTATIGAVGLALALCLDVVLSGLVPAPGTGLAQTRRQLLDGSSGAEVPFDATDSQAPGGVLPGPHPVRFANPLYALQDLVTGGDGMPAGRLANRVVPGSRSLSTWGVKVGAWQFSLAVQLVLSVVLVGMATRLVAGHEAPRRRRLGHAPSRAVLT